MLAVVNSTVQINLCQYGKAGAAPTVAAPGAVAVWRFILAAWVLIRAERTQALDRAYLGAVMTPFWAILSLLFARFLT